MSFIYPASWPGTSSSLLYFRALGRPDISETEDNLYVFVPLFQKIYSELNKTLKKQSSKYFMNTQVRCNSCKQLIVFRKDHDSRFAPYDGADGKRHRCVGLVDVIKAIDGRAASSGIKRVLPVASVMSNHARLKHETTVSSFLFDVRLRRQKLKASRVVLVKAAPPIVTNEVAVLAAQAHPVINQRVSNSRQRRFERRLAKITDPGSRIPPGEPSAHSSR